MAVTLLWPASAAYARRAAPAPRGNAQGLALLRRVHGAYRHVAAVQMTTRLGAERARFTLWLRKGVATAEQFVGVTPSGTTILVERASGPTYAREAGATCWRRLARSDSQSLEDVGMRFPDDYRMLVEAPRRKGATWLLPIVSQGRYPGERSAFTLHIDASTMRIKTETGRVSGHTLTEYVKTLNRRPKLATPTPAC